MNREGLLPQLLEGLLFPKIFQNLLIIAHPSKIIVALLGLSVIWLAGSLMDLNKTVVVSEYATTELQVYMDSSNKPENLEQFIEQNKESGRRQGLFFTLWRFSSQRFHNAVKSLFAFDLPSVASNIADCFKAARWAVTYHFFYCLVFFAIAICVISLVGRTLC